LVIHRTLPKKKTTNSVDKDTRGFYAGMQDINDCNR